MLIPDLLGFKLGLVLPKTNKNSRKRKKTELVFSGMPLQLPRGTGNIILSRYSTNLGLTDVCLDSYLIIFSWRPLKLVISENNILS